MAQYLQRVPASGDDGYWAGSWDYTPSSNGIGKNFFGQDVYTGLRFASVNVPQGTTITSAYLRITDAQNDSYSIAYKIFGIKETDTASLTSDPVGRTKTTASTSVSQTGSSTDTVRTYNVTSIVQEIINQGGWSSGNHLGFITQDNGTSNSSILRYYSYDGSTTKCAQLEINWGGASPSASVSPSTSVSPSISASTSPSSSLSASASPSPSPMPPANQAILKIAKPGVNVLTNSDIEKLIFSSEYGTLKYFDKQALNLSFDASNGDITCRGSVDHNLGYYPFVEVYVSVYIGSPTGIYEYCPFVGSGASVAYLANIKIDENKIWLYGEISGSSESVWHFDFLVFVYKNDLSL